MSAQKMKEEFVAYCSEPAGNSGLEVGDTFSGDGGDAFIGFVGGRQAACASKQQEIEGLQAAARFWQDRAGDNQQQILELAAQVEVMRAKLEALERQEPLGYADKAQFERWCALKGTEYEAPERCYMPFSVTPYKTDLSDCSLPIYAKPVSATPAIPEGCLIERSFIRVADNTYQPTLTIRFPIGEDSDGLWLARDTFAAMLASAPKPLANEGEL